MEVQVILFGQLCDITGTDHLTLHDVNDVRSLRDFLNKKYPAMASMKYLIAIDKKMVEDNVSLDEKNTVALLPPFSGG